MGFAVVFRQKPLDKSMYPMNQETVCPRKVIPFLESNEYFLIFVLTWAAFFAKDFDFVVNTTDFSAR